MQKLSVKALALAMGIVCGGGALLIGWVSIGGYGRQFVETMASFYLGYSSSFAGGLIGGLWGFVDGLAAGAVVALVYNAVGQKKDSCCS